VGIDADLMEASNNGRVTPPRIAADHDPIWPLPIAHKVSRAMRSQ